MKYSQYQKDIFAFVKDGEGNAIINAVAGSGKTTTIVTALNFIPKDKAVLFLAFNKNIVEELKTKVPTNVQVRTFHSLGMSFITARTKGIKVDSNKVRRIVQEQIPPTIQYKYGQWITRMVSLAKQNGVGALIPNTPDSWSALADHYGVPLESNGDASEAEAIEWGQEVLKMSNKDTKTMDFDDMVYWPCLFKMTTKFQYDFVFVDEAQDTSLIQVSLLKKVLKPGGRLIAVGDPFQAIYGFRGADSSAISNIAEAFSCQELPLSISYRCSRAVAELARQIVPHFEVGDHNLDGKVETLTDLQKNLHLFTKDSAVLCRNTAPLISFAYFLLRNKIPCKVLGREIGQGLVSLIKKVAGKTIKDIDKLEEKLLNYRDREVQKLVGAFKESQAQVVDDKVQSVLFFIQNLPEDNRTISGLIEEIESMFGEGKGMLVLSTIHKAKGLEWDRVFILNRFLMPSRYAIKQWQRDQERNLEYVAYTRTKNELYFVSYNKEK